MIQVNDIWICIQKVIMMIKTQKNESTFCIKTDKESKIWFFYYCFLPWIFIKVYFFLIFLLKKKIESLFESFYDSNDSLL